MNPFRPIERLLAERRRRRINARLEATMKPDPLYRKRRLAQFPPERRDRYERNTEFLR